MNLDEFWLLEYFGLLDDIRYPWDVFLIRDVFWSKHRLLNDLWNMETKLTSDLRCIQGSKYMDELVLANGRKQTVVKCYLYFHIVMIRNNMLIYIDNIDNKDH